MALDTPIVCSAQPAVREVVGDAAVLVGRRRRRRRRGVGGGRCRRRSAGATNSSPQAARAAASSRSRHPGRRSAAAYRQAARPDEDHRALPALRTRHGADRRRDDAASSTSWRAAATSCTSSRRCPGTARIASSRNGVAGRMRDRGDAMGFGHPRRIRSRATTSRTSPGGRSGSPASRRWPASPASAPAGSCAEPMPCWRCRRRCRSGSPGGLVGVVRGAPLVFNVQDIFPDAAVRTGAIRNRRVIALAAWLERAHVPPGGGGDRAQRGPATQRRRQGRRARAGTRCT